MRWMRGLLMVAVVAVLLGVVEVSAAQPGGPPDGPAAGAPGPKQRVRMRLLQRRVGLDDATAQKVMEVLRTYEGRRQALADRMQQNKRALGKLIREDSNDQASYQRAVDELVRTQREMEALRLEEFAELRKVLTPKQQAKLLMELNKLMQRRQERRHGGGGPPPGRGPR